MNDILAKDPAYVVFDEYRNITDLTTISNYLYHRNLILLDNISGSWDSVSSIQNNPTDYTIKINTNSPNLLCFAESYDPNWEMHIYREGTYITSIQSTPLLSTLNSFLINETGNLTLSITYKPQQWFNIGVALSILTILLCFLYVLLDYTNHIRIVEDILKKIKFIIKVKK